MKKVTEQAGVSWFDAEVEHLVTSIESPRIRFYDERGQPNWSVESGIMRWPLRNQILLPMTSVMLVTLVGVSALHAWISARWAKEQIEHQLRNVTRTLADSNFPLTDNVLQQMRGLTGAEFVVVDEQGAVLASSQDRAPFRQLPHSSAPQKGSQLVLGEPIPVDDRLFFHTVVSIQRNESPVKPILLHILYPQQSYSQIWRNAVVPPLIIGGVALALVIFLGVVIASRVSRPIGRLRHQVDQVSAGSFHPMQLSRRNDEILDLGKAVNRMVEMLARYEDEVRRNERLRTLGKLGGGIAHQMRNSATGCRMALDLHRRDCQLSQTCESFEVASRQLALMERYLQRFLSLGNPRDTTRRPVELSEVVENTLPLVRPSANHIGVQLDWSPPAQRYMINADSDALQQLLINLLLNAVEAAARWDDASCSSGMDKRVVVQIEPSGDDRIALQVLDTGQGPALEIQDRLFEPLVTEKIDGVGLGLSLAQEIATQHDGSIGWDRRDQMTCFAVQLPLLSMENKSAEPTGS